MKTLLSNPFVPFALAGTFLLAAPAARSQEAGRPCTTESHGKSPCCATGEKKKSCCQQSANAQFAMLGQDPSFTGAHAAPLPFTYVPHGGKWISLPCADGKDARAFFVESPTPTKNYLVVIHEWWGLNDYILEMAEKLFHDVGNTHVLAVDLYDGKTTTDAGEAGQLMQAAPEERIRNIIAAALAYAGEDATIQTIGWCFGGTWSLQTALMAGDRAAGCVIYYGQPEKDRDKLARLHGPVLGIYGDRDDWVTPAVVAGFEKDLQSLKKTYTFKRYDAVHAFANPSNPNHNKAYADEAYAAATAFLKKHFGAGKR